MSDSYPTNPITQVNKKGLPIIPGLSDEGELKPSRRMPFKSLPSNNNLKTGVIWQMPEWVDYMLGDELSGSEGAYTDVPLIYRAMRMRCDTLASLPYHVEDESGTVVDWPFPADLYNLLWYTEAGMLLYGHGEWLRIGEQTETTDYVRRNVTDVMWLHTRYLIPWYDPSKDTVWFNYTHPGPWTGRYNLDSVVYFREFNPIHNFLWGPGAAQVALAAASLDHYLTRFASGFFEHGAMPVVMLSPEGNVTKDEVERAENWFRRNMTVVRNAFRVFASRIKWTPQIITPPFNNLAIPDLYKQAREQVAKAFGIRQTLLDDAATFATAKEDRLSFYEDTIIPRSKMYASNINIQLFKGSGLKLIFDYEELPVFQANEADRGRSLFYVTKAGMPLNLAMELLGYQLSDDQWKLVGGEPGIESAGGPEPDTTSTTEKNPAEATESEPAGIVTSEQDKSLASKAALNQWRDKAVAARRNGKSADVPFETKLVPEFVAKWLRMKLPAAKTVEEVKAIFAKAREDMAGTELVLLPLEKPDPMLLLANELKRANDLLEKTA